MQMPQQPILQQPMPSQQYPNYPPPDSQVRYDGRIVTTNLNPKSHNKKAKFCPICDFPASVRVVMMPCKHYMCYECYFIDGQTFCRFCNDVITSWKRLDDVETFHSCEQDTCNKYFESQAEYDAHLKMHVTI